MADSARTRRQLLTPPARADTASLQRLARVELLLLFAYDQIVGSSVLPAPARRSMTELRNAERSHVAALRSRLRARRAPVPSGPGNVGEANRFLARRHVQGRLGHLQSADDALFLLRALERVVVGAYFVALREMRDPALVLLAAQIMASDSQHEAVIGLQLYPGDIPDAVPFGLVQGVQ